jgi:hypothetical protein
MSRRRRCSHAARLIAVVVVLLVAIWLLYRNFIAIAPAPPPAVTRSQVPATAAAEAALPTLRQLRVQPTLRQLQA